MSNMILSSETVDLQRRRCAVCGRPEAHYRCGGRWESRTCDVHYCSQACQALHWRDGHADLCCGRGGQPEEVLAKRLSKKGYSLWKTWRSQRNPLKKSTSLLPPPHPSHLTSSLIGNRDKMQVDEMELDIQDSKENQEEDSSAMEAISQPDEKILQLFVDENAQGLTNDLLVGMIFIHVPNPGDLAFMYARSPKTAAALENAFALPYVQNRIRYMLHMDPLTGLLNDIPMNKPLPKVTPSEEQAEEQLRDPRLLLTDPFKRWIMTINLMWTSYLTRYQDLVPFHLPVDQQYAWTLSNRPYNWPAVLLTCPVSLWLQVLTLLYALFKEQNPEERILYLTIYMYLANHYPPGSQSRVDAEIALRIVISYLSEAYPTPWERGDRSLLVKSQVPNFLLNSNAPSSDMLPSLATMDPLIMLLVQTPRYVSMASSQISYGYGQKSERTVVEALIWQLLHFDRDYLLVGVLKWLKPAQFTERDRHSFSPRLLWTIFDRYRYRTSDLIPNVEVLFRELVDFSNVAHIIENPYALDYITSSDLNGLYTLKSFLLMKAGERPLRENDYRYLLTSPALALRQIMNVSQFGKTVVGGALLHRSMLDYGRYGDYNTWFRICFMIGLKDIALTDYLCSRILLSLLPPRTVGHLLSTTNNDNDDDNDDNDDDDDDDDSNDGKSKKDAQDPPTWEHWCRSPGPPYFEPNLIRTILQDGRLSLIHQRMVQFMKEDPVAGAFGSKAERFWEESNFSSNIGPRMKTPPLYWLVLHISVLETRSFILFSPEDDKVLVKRLGDLMLIFALETPFGRYGQKILFHAPEDYHTYAPEVAKRRLVFDFEKRLLTLAQRFLHCGVLWNLQHRRQLPYKYNSRAVLTTNIWNENDGELLIDILDKRPQEASELIRDLIRSWPTLINTGQIRFHLLKFIVKNDDSFLLRLVCDQWRQHPTVRPRSIHPIAKTLARQLNRTTILDMLETYEKAVQDEPTPVAQT